MFGKAYRERLDRIELRLKSLENSDWPRSIHSLIISVQKTILDSQKRVEQDSIQTMQSFTQALHGPEYDINTDRKGGLITRLERLEQGQNVLKADLDALREWFHALNEDAARHDKAQDVQHLQQHQKGLATLERIGAIERKLMLLHLDTDIEAIAKATLRPKANGKRKP